MPKKYRPRNTDTVDAYQFTDLASLRGILAWLNSTDAIVRIVDGEKVEATVMANNEHGNMQQQVRFRLTEWVVRVDDRYRVCNDETFRATYEEMVSLDCGPIVVNQHISPLDVGKLAAQIAARPEGAR